MTLGMTLLIIGVFCGLSTLHTLAFGWGDDTTPDLESDPKGHAGGNKFGLLLTAALLFCGGALYLFGI
jgi:hypothetical protein